MIFLKYLQNQTFLVLECLFNYFFYLFIIRILYELFTEKKAFQNYSSQGGIGIYNLIHNTKFDFFNYN